MRYLKYINETVKEDVEADLIRIANESLVYLIDEGYKVWSNSSRHGNTKNSTTFLNMCKQNSLEVFKWQDIKEDYITFIHYISEKYDIDNIQTTLTTYTPPGQTNHNSGSGFSNTEYTFDDVINDSINDEVTMTQINLYVKVFY